MSTLRFVPALRWFRRDAETVQFGVDQRRAHILQLPEERLFGLLDLFDGSHDRRSYLRAARRRGVDEASAVRVLELLAEAGIVLASEALTPPPRRCGADDRERLVAEAGAIALRRALAPGTPAQMLAARTRARVQVNGAGPLVEETADVLRRAGIGRVWTGASRRWSPTFAVLVDQASPARLLAMAYAGRGLPHLSVASRDGTVCVGPLVVPGRSACLNCVDMYRAERDPCWGTVDAHGRMGRGGDVLETVVRAVAAGVIAAQVLGHVDGSLPQALEATLDVAAPGVVRHSRWSPHPGCGCREATAVL